MAENTSIERVDKKELNTVAEGTHSGRYYEPLVDIYENDHELTLLADMPGVSEKDVEIDLREGVLTLLGKQGTRERPQNIEYQEFDYGNYLRKFTLTDVVDQTKITAALRDGVLTVVLPKAERAKPRKIQVKVG